MIVCVFFVNCIMLMKRLLCYDSVFCVKIGGICFILSGNFLFFMVFIYNVVGVGGVQLVMIKSDFMGYIFMFCNWGVNWFVKIGLMGVFFFMIIGVDGCVFEMLVVVLVGWVIGQMYQVG